ncbi:MAG: hypothetical protein A3K83_01750 [Omnitrophica WOR_2 bacterium RBG_13_44_8b]|nr:MAG: hypothetical protein A3K83_01750 [Omnitrophica WOR_2 bacterium RBG_13_44_8b]
MTEQELTSQAIEPSTVVHRPTQGDYIRALRLPFISASVFPFIFGSFIHTGRFRFWPFIFGLVSAAATHLGANLINDYADSRSGADWQDKKFYSFFGGSKLIQEKVLSEKTYLQLGLSCFLLALCSVFILAWLLRDASVIAYFAIIAFLGFSYSHKPFAFSYHRLGEPVLLILFGLAPVMGAYFIQTGHFPALKSFSFSLPFGFFTTAILFANEVPDFNDDQKCAKFTWVSLTRPDKAWVLYYALVLLGFFYIAVNVKLKFLPPLALVSFVFMPFSLAAGRILKKSYHDKTALLTSSRLTIALHAFASIVLIISAIL